MTQTFKGDSTELKMIAAVDPAMVLIGTALDAFYENGYSSVEFLLGLYDSGRMPFSDRVPRDSFASFIQELIEQFVVTGSFDSYLFIIEKVFGEGSDVLFEVPAAGKLNMLINAVAALEFDFIAREFNEGLYSDYEIVTSDGYNIQFRGVSGIDNEYQLTQLMSELIPAGIFPDITLAFFTLSIWISEYGGSTYDMVNFDGDSLVFFEL